MTYISASNYLYSADYTYDLWTTATADITHIVDEKNFVGKPSYRHMHPESKFLESVTYEDGSTLTTYLEPENVTDTSSPNKQEWERTRQIFRKVTFLERSELSAPQVNTIAIPASTTPVPPTVVDLTQSDVADQSASWFDGVDNLAKEWVPGYSKYAAVRDTLQTVSNAISTVTRPVMEYVVEPVWNRLPEKVQNGVTTTLYIGTPLFLIYFLFFRRTTVNVQNNIVLDKKAFEGLRTAFAQQHKVNPVSSAKLTERAAAPAA